MRMRNWIALLLVVPFLGAATCSSDVPGYDELDNTLTGEERARKGVFDAAAAYVPVQVVFETAVSDPALPSNYKTAIQRIDREMTAAITAYRDAVVAGADDTTAKLQTAIEVLGRAQALLLELQVEGLVG